jgi:hypothetical protein
MLVMRNEREDPVVIGPVSIEYQAAVIRDELEESAGWTTVGIARVLTEKQARTIARRREADRRKTCCPLLGGMSAWQPASLPSPLATGGRSLNRKEGRR